MEMGETQPQPQTRRKSQPFRRKIAYMETRLYHEQGVEFLPYLRLQIVLEKFEGICKHQKRKMSTVKIRRTLNGSKYCIFANCTSDGRTLPKDTDVTFITFPKPCTKYRDEEIEYLLNKKSGKREHNTSKCSKCSRSLRWIHLSGRTDRLKKLTDITKSMYVCSKHFLECDKTDGSADPLAANIPVSEISRRKKRKQSIDRSGIVPQKQSRKVTPDDMTQNLVTVNDCIANTQVPTAELLTPTLELVTFVQRIPPGWANLVKENVASFIKYDTKALSCLMEIRMIQDGQQLTCHTFVLGQSLPAGSDMEIMQSEVKSYEHAQHFMQLLDTTDLCKGIVNPVSLSEFNKMSSSTDGKFCYRTNAIRSVNCKLFSDGSKCAECETCEQKLHTQLKKRAVTVRHKKCNNGYRKTGCL